MKRILKNCLSLILVLTILTGSAYAGLNEIDFSGIFAVKASAASESDLTFTLNDNGKSYSVTACNKSAKGKLAIPSTYKGLPVTSIGSSAFSRCKSLTYITIPNSVTNIGNSAFYSCGRLTSITIPDSVTSIGSSAFKECDYLTSVTIPNSITKIRNKTFYNCRNLTDFTIPDSVKSIGDYAFYNCESLTSFTIPNSVTSIGDYAFESCDNFAPITIPDSVTSLGDGAFCGCTYLESVTIGKGVTSIGNSTFKGCVRLTSITIPDSVTSIGNNAFENCCVLTDITIPDSVKSIGDYAFDTCQSLTTVTLGNGVTSIGEYPFCACFRLTSINVNENNAYFSSDNGILFDKDKTHLIKYPQAKTDTNYTLPDSVTHIEDRAFYDCGKLASVDLPEGLISIGYYAFYRCTSLTDIMIPDSVTSIDKCAFNVCYNLKNCTLSKNLKSLPYALFSGCNKLTDITLPDGLTVIGDSAFSGCERITSIVIPNGVTKIGKSAFAGCESLDSIIIPDSVTQLGESAFASCRNLTTAVLTDGLKKIPYRLFYDAEILTAVAIPESVTLIGESAFDGCRKLQTIIYGGSVDSLGKVVVESGNDSIFGAVVYCLKPSTPKLSKIENKTGGVKITWGKTAGAESYNVYRKTYSNGKWSSWSEIKTGATGTSYTDTNVKSGEYYRYTVRAKNESGLSGYDSTGLKIKFLSTPKLSSIANGSGKVTVKWGKVTGASSYTVYRKTYSNGKWSGWSKIGTTKNTYYNDAKVSSGKYYKYTVRATSGDYTSYYDTNGLQIKYLAVAPLKSAVSQSAGVKVTWGKVTGAKGYEVYRRTYSKGKWSDWTKIKTVSSGSTVSYTDKTAKKGVTYKYTVRAISDSNRGYYNTSGLQVKDTY